MEISVNCPWGYASPTEDGLVAHGETIVAPETETVLDSFSFYVTQLRDSEGQFLGDSRIISYEAYVGKWDGTTVTETVWQSNPSVPLTVTTSPDPAEWKTTVQTGGVQLEPGQHYALFFSTLETNANEFNTLEDRGCGVQGSDNGNPDGASLVRYLSDTSWRVGVFGTDNAFEASFSAPAGGGEETVYDFDGFYSPVNNKDAQGNYVLNKAKAGSAIPVKFSLGGDYGLDVFETGFPKSQVIACDSRRKSTVSRRP